MAEWTALRELTDDVRQIMTPCLKLLPRELAADSSDDRAHAMRGFAKRIRRNWGPRPILVDVSLLSSTVRHEPVALLAQAARAYDISPIVALSPYEAPLFMRQRANQSRPECCPWLCVSTTASSRRTTQPTVST
jgi:hypothetical protein